MMQIWWIIRCFAYWEELTKYFKNSHDINRSEVVSHFNGKRDESKAKNEKEKNMDFYEEYKKYKVEHPFLNLEN